MMGNSNNSNGSGFRYTKIGPDGWRLGPFGFSCAVCGESLEPGDEAAVCPDCGAVICRSCCEAGLFGEHECGDGDFGDEKE